MPTKTSAPQLNGISKLISVIVLLVTTLLALGVGWGVMTNNVSVNASTIVEIKKEVKEHDTRLDYLEQQRSATDEILKNIDRNLKEIKEQLKKNGGE